MIANVDPDADAPQLAVIDIGNARIRMGTWNDGNVTNVTGVSTSDARGFGALFGELCGSFERGRPTAVVVGSVVPAVWDRVRGQIEEATDLEALAVGADLPLPMDLDLRSPETVGVDRVCSAAAAFEKVGQACIVVDFGSAVTVDLAGDNGRFLGGAILPGAGMQARALHAFTAQLPEVEVQFPPRTVGDDTISAIQSGICHGIAGSVRGIIEAMATEVGKWPQVVGTGGDLELFLPHCNFLDSPVPDLCLMGIGLACARRDAEAE